MELKIGSTILHKWIEYGSPEGDALIDKYMPSRGEGDNMASQAVTALNKLCYKWFNDGDVFDNTYNMRGWCNDLSDYANWLDCNIDGAHDILSHIEDCYLYDDYQHLLDCLAHLILQPELLADLEKRPKTGSIYNQRGSWRFVENTDDVEDYE